MGCSFFRMFLKEFFDFGYNCGSLISEIFGIIKTFQRITATISFKTRFSPECVKMFDWALVVIDTITGIAFTNPFTDFEIYHVYTLIIPLTILTFLLRLVLPISLFILAIIPTGFLLMLSCGLGFIGVNNIIAISLSVIGGVFALMSILIINCRVSFRKFIEKAKTRSITVGNFLFSLRVAFFIGYALMIPIMIDRESFCNFFTIIMIAIAGIVIIASIIICHCKTSYYEKEVGVKVVDFINMILQLLIIPSTENFIELKESVYKNDWRCIISYIVLSIVFPLLITFLNIFYGGGTPGDKYKIDSWHQYVALIDIVKQIAYAVSGGFDCAWGCLFIELGWIVFLLISRPFVRLCEYFLEVGNSIVMIIANSVVLYSQYQKSDMFSIDVAIPLIVIAFIPAIVALYVYFSIDFGKIKVEKANTVEIISCASLLITPIAWIFYGLNLSLITKKVSKKSL